ncbi:MAG TPA: hypothetical protein VJ901_20525 [Thermoanaerobaculia bacterium]|nr:hypothetical protein [Thermoanaerobaculia bacterium]
MQSLTLGSPEAEAGVRAQGDAYVAAQITKFDGVTIAPNDTLIGRIENIVMPSVVEAPAGAVAR